MATKLYLPNLLEFIYHCIIEKGFKFLFDRLDREDWLKVRNESKVRTFAEQANLEDKMILLSKLGIGCAVVFWDKEKEKKKKVENVVIGYVDTDENDLTKQIIKDKVFACRDIDFIKSLLTMCRSAMSNVYSVNRKYYQIKENAGLKTRTLVNKLEAESGLEWYSKTIQFVYEIEPILEHFKINVAQFRILLCLHLSPNGATKDHLQKKLDRINIQGMLNDMYEANMVSFSQNNRNVVNIDVYGLMILEQIFSKFP